MKNIISFPVDAPDSSELRLGAAVAAAARNIPFEEVLSDRLKLGLPVYVPVVANSIQAKLNTHVMADLDRQQ